MSDSFERDLAAWRREQDVAGLRAEVERLHKGLQDLLDKHDHEDSKKGHWFSYISPDEIAEVLRPGSGRG
ncbi:MAG TPA: hypothetical protein VFG99_06000 [Chloroflexia bacterium]|nr:hypothetical protein [Chloroflexia bacterium]